MKIADAPGTADHGLDTRSRVLRSLLEDGPATAGTLAQRLGLTAPAVRRHLDALVAEGRVAGGDRMPYGPTSSVRGRGRPARVYAVTEAGREPFAQAYDDLAVSVLRFLALHGGGSALDDFARTQVAVLEERYRPEVGAAAPGHEVEALAAALRADGYAAVAQPAPSGRGDQLCQHHCPVAHVAAQFPQLCEAETEAFARLLDRPVQRLATIAHGDHLCTTFVPHRAGPAERSAR